MVRRLKYWNWQSAINMNNVRIINDPSRTGMDKPAKPLTRECNI